jgi:hypothetical protein
MTAHSRRRRGRTPPTGLAMRCRRNGRCGPVLLCAACRKPIADARAGVVLWDATVQDAPPTFAHVGGCCHAAEGRSGPVLDSMPLSAWLVYLANGCKLKWMKAGRLAVALANIG